MSTYAKIQNGIVTEIIVADALFINSGVVGNPSHWIETSHDGGFRNVYAGIGYTYDAEKDIFIGPKPFPSWVLKESSVQTLDTGSMEIVTTGVILDWAAPVDKPKDNFTYNWNEELMAWEEYAMFVPFSGSLP
jgi:hypothetical protein